MIRKLTYLIILLIVTSCGEEKSVEIIELNKNNCNVYLKKVMWGITGDNYCTYISLNDILKDTAKEPYFRSMDFFFKLNSQCDLEVFNSDALKGKEREFGNKVKVLQNKETKIYYTNYKDFGLQSILWTHSKSLE